MHPFFFLLCLSLLSVFSTSSDRPTTAISHHYDQLHQEHPSSIYLTVNDIDKEKILSYFENLILKVASANDRLSSHQVTSKYTYFASGNSNEHTSSVVHHIFAKLRSTRLVKNTTFIIAIMYIDRIAHILKVFPNRHTLKRLLAGTLMVASTIHGGGVEDLSRSSLAELFEIPVEDLYETECVILNECHDYSIHPQALLSYLEPLHLATSSSHASQNAAVLPHTAHPSYHSHPQYPHHSTHSSYNNH